MPDHAPVSICSLEGSSLPASVILQAGAIGIFGAGGAPCYVTNRLIVRFFRENLA